MKTVTATSIRRLCCLALILPALLTAGTCRAQTQEVKIWEFSPYNVRIWYSIDPNVAIPDAAQQKYITQLHAALKRTFRATWKVSFAPIPPNLADLVVENFDDFTTQDLQTNDLVLVTSVENEQTKTIRSFAAAIDNLSKVHISPRGEQQLKSEAQRLQLPADSETSHLLSKCVADDSGDTSLLEQLKSGKIAAAMLPRKSIPQDRSGIRQLVTMLPWQAESVFREYDKLFFLHISRDGDKLVFRVRELDCPMRFLGTSFESSSLTWQQAVRTSASTVVRAFAPIARVEEAESRTARLTLRAGGLIVSDENPAKIRIGDMLQPVVRRDDRNGVPALLQPLSFTFAAVTGSDGINLDSNVYTYSGGPGLQGRKNRRTSRVLFRVRPKYRETDLQIVTINTDGQPQAGCFIYQKDLLNDEFEFLGRTDWRGQLTIPVPTINGSFIAYEVKKARFAEKQQAETKAEQAAVPKTDQDSAAEVASDTETQAEPEEQKEPEYVASQYDASSDPDAIPLNHPFMQIFIRSGNTTLARLPMVPGLKSVEVAELPDDTARLQAEAFVKGFQGEVLDVIGLRSLLAARVKLYIKEAVKDKEKRQEKLDLAEKYLDQLRRLPTYSEMSTQLERIQRDLGDKRTGPVSARSQNAIDRMFKVTRDMLQKFMQDNLVAETEQSFRLAKTGR